MVLPERLARINKRVTNPVLRHLVGLGPMAELEHVGRRSGRAYRTTLMAFRRGDTVTLALTYGSDVDWLKNLRAAAGGRLRLGRDLLILGAPRTIPTAEGLSRMPLGPRQLLPVAGVEEFVELPVLSVRHRTSR
jgi:deazaflavin-dependent oxidoreductase (nitroreductase family)